MGKNEIHPFTQLHNEMNRILLYKNADPGKTYSIQYTDTQIKGLISDIMDLIYDPNLPSPNDRPQKADLLSELEKFCDV